MDTIGQMKLYRQIAVWRKLNNRRAVRYQCIEDLSEHKFAVQTGDFFTEPLKNEHLMYLDKLFAERFLADWSERKWFDSIEEAISNFEKPLPDLDVTSS